MTETARGSYFPLLGSDVEIRVNASTTEQAQAAEQATAAEVHRLHDLFSIYSQTSPLHRWAHEHTNELPPEVSEVLRIAQEWFELSQGAFHPAAAGLRRLWIRAEDAGTPPSQQELSEVAESLRTLPYTVDASGMVARTGSCADIDLNAVAKGYILDRAADLAMRQPGVTCVVISADGELRHQGEKTVTVSIELAPVDAEAAVPALGTTAPLSWVTLGNAGLATTGRPRAGFKVGSQWFNATIDPRTGVPVQGLRALSVVAPDTLTADLLATVLAVTSPEDAREFIRRHDGCSFLRVGATGDTYRSPGWPGKP